MTKKIIIIGDDLHQKTLVELFKLQEIQIEEVGLSLINSAYFEPKLIKEFVLKGGDNGNKTNIHTKRKLRRNFRRNGHKCGGSLSKTFNRARNKR